MRILYEIEKFPKSICPQSIEFDNKKELFISAKIVENLDGTIDFLPYVNPLEIYLEQHNSSIGKTWDIHNEFFAKKIFQYEKFNIIEIGGGSGNIYKKYKEINNKVKWTLIDLNPSIIDDELNLIKGKYNVDYINNNDTVISSHFLEHIVEIETFLTELRIKKPKYHIFSIPNFKKIIELNYCPTITFEHPHFLTEEVINYILKKTGWKIIDKTYYNNHSIFFVTIPIDYIIDEKIKINQSHLIINWIEYIKNRAEKLKKFKKIYVFGAHYPFYYFLNFGVLEEQIISVVDNDITKVSKRMYGTNTKIVHPTELQPNSKIIVEMGPYTEEIKQKLKDIIFI